MSSSKAQIEAFGNKFPYKKEPAYPPKEVRRFCCAVALLGRGGLYCLLALHHDRVGVGLPLARLHLPVAPALRGFRDHLGRDLHVDRGAVADGVSRAHGSNLPLRAPVIGCEAEPQKDDTLRPVEHRLAHDTAFVEPELEQELFGERTWVGDAELAVAAGELHERRRPDDVLDLVLVEAARLGLHRVLADDELASVAVVGRVLELPVEVFVFEKSHAALRIFLVHGVLRNR